MRTPPTSEMWDEAMGELESAANFLRGMSLDPRLHSDIKVVVIGKANQLDSLVEELVGDDDGDDGDG